MTNRQKIEKFCKERGFKVLSLEFNRDTDACYGDTWRADYWALQIEYKGEKYWFLTERGSGEISEDIDAMFENILDTFDIISQLQGATQ